MPIDIEIIGNLMGIKSTTEAFIKKAKTIHGDVYDYSECFYVNNSTKVTIICKIPDHGEFHILPSNHTRIKATGCPKCSKEFQASQFRSTTPDFIIKAKAIHGDMYNYERVDYKGAFEPVDIICQKHGSFMQQPTSHLGGAGCNKCAAEKTSERCLKPVEDFIKSSRELHGDKFDYSAVDYQGSWKPVKIHCPDHGWFEQAPVNHLNSTHGCSKCAVVNKKSQPKRIKIISPETMLKNRDDFIKQAREVHGDKYGYSNVNFRFKRNKVKIICPIHGEFEQTPTSHLRGSRCNQCSNLIISLKQRSSNNDFIQKARGKHGDYYDYSKVDYLTARKQVIIICPKHGEFRQVPDAHLSKGCRKCADEALPGAYSLKKISRDPVLANKNTILYYIKFMSEDEMFYKIGITTKKSIKARYSGHESATGYSIEVLAEWSMTLAKAYKIEQEIKNNHCSIYKYKPVNRNRDREFMTGHTECFSQPLPEGFVINLINALTLPPETKP